MAANKNISVFPNPAANVLKISLENGVKLNPVVEIFNYAGASVKRVELQDLSTKQLTIEVSDLAKGMYFVKLKSNEGDMVRSFIKE